MTPLSVIGLCPIQSLALFVYGFNFISTKCAKTFDIDNKIIGLFDRKRLFNGFFQPFEEFKGKVKNIEKFSIKPSRFLVKKYGKRGY